MSQLLLDSLRQGSLQGVYGNPIKLALSILSFVFDYVFIYQHHFLYANPDKEGCDEILPEEET